MTFERTPPDEPGLIDARRAAATIKYKLACRNYSLAKIALEAQVSQAVVSNTINGRATSFRVAKKICEVLGEELSDLFPGRYQFRPRNSSGESTTKHQQGRPKKG